MVDRFVPIFYIFAYFSCLLVLSITESGIFESAAMTVESFVAPFFFYYKILLRDILKQCYQVFTHLPIHKD